MKRFFRPSATITTLLSLLLTTHSLWAQQPCTTAVAANRIQLKPGGHPIWGTVGDVDGDGNRDMIMTDQSDSSISIMRGKGNGGFQTAQRLYVADLPYAVVATDLNGDGQDDIAYSDLKTHSVYAMISNHAGGFDSPVSAFSSVNVHSIVSVDFNHDNIMDLAAADLESNSIIIAIGIGNGQFAQANAMPVGGSPRSITSGDFNGDGHPDVATSNFDGTASTVYVLYGNGDGSFGADRQINLTSTSEFITSADFDNDGQTDLAVCTGGTGDVTIIKGHTHGFSSPIRLDIAGENVPTSIGIGDFNEDGHLDVATGDGVSIFLGDGHANFQLNENYFHSGRSSCLVTSDFNNDHHTDLISISADDNAMNILRGQGSGSFDDDAKDFTPSARLTQPSCDIAGGVILVVNESFNDSFSFDNGQTFQDSSAISDLAAGRYQIITKDISGCLSKPLTVEIVQRPQAAQKPTVGFSQPSCKDNNGFINVLVQRSDDTYSFDSGDNFEASNLKSVKPGTYSVMIRTSGGCISEAISVTINAAPTGPVLPTIALEQPTCTQAKGKIVVTAINNGETYSFDGGITFQSSNTKANAKPGQYSVMIRSVEGCYSSLISTEIYAQPASPSKPKITVDYSNPSIPVLTTTQNDTYQWYRNNQPIFGAVYREFEAEDGGEYSVIVANFNGCVGPESDEVPLIVTAIDAQLAETSISVFPNPTTDKIQVDLRGFTGTEKVQLTIFSGQGAIMHQVAVDGGSEPTINVQHFSDGKYMLVMKQADQRAGVAFIKQ